jgi:hypothetical protein
MGVNHDPSHEGKNIDWFEYSECAEGNSWTKEAGSGRKLEKTAQWRT